MPKVVIGTQGTTLGSLASNNGSGTVTFTPAKNPDGSAVKDTRS